MLTATAPAQPLPLGTEHRLEQFAQLVAAAVGNSQARTELTMLADEQAALRRVAELSARGASGDDVLAAVAVEGSRLSGVDFTTLLRYAADGSTEIVALDGAPVGVVVGMRASGAGDGAVQQLWRTGRAARVDDLSLVSGRWPQIAHGSGFAASVAVPILLEGTLWGALVVVSRHQPLPRGIEDRLADYADLVGAAISAAEARLRLRALADEQVALRRVAELVARGAAPDEVFVAVSDEASALLGGLAAVLLRYEGDVAVAVATCNSPAPLGLRVPSHAGTPTGSVLRTGRPVRVDTFDGTPLADTARELGVASGVAVPISVGGRVRATLTTSSPGPPLPEDTEARLAQFAELAAVAIANAETNSKLTASRARIVATADETRRRLQRDVHDGAQQRLVHAVIALKMARSTVEGGSAAAGLVEEALTNVERASSELRDIVHGILPRSLTYGGLRVGLESLVADLTLPVDVRVTTPRLPAATETTAYFIVAESLTNAVKHSQAQQASVRVDLDGDTLVVEVRDDGVGGADPDRGTGLTGLLDRVDAAGGALTIVSPVGDGTTVRVELPVGSGDDRKPTRGGVLGSS
jgi:signal transduction histidine kinase